MNRSGTVIASISPDVGKEISVTDKSLTFQVFLEELTNVVQAWGCRRVKGVRVGSRDGRGRHLRGRAVAAEHIAVGADFENNIFYVSFLQNIYKKL